MWELASCLARDTKVINDFLGQGFNPFAVTTDAYGERIWLKKELVSEEDEVARADAFKFYLESVKGMAEYTLHNKPVKPDKGTNLTKPDDKDYLFAAEENIRVATPFAKGAIDAIYRKPVKPDKGTSRRAPAKSKRKDSSGLGDSKPG